MEKFTRKKLLDVLSVATKRGDEVIELLELSKIDEALDLLTKRKAAIYNSFSLYDLKSISLEEAEVVDNAINKLLLQNDLLEDKISQKKLEVKTDLKKVVEKKFQFRGYVGATNFKSTKFEGKA
jgi:hypothetical protein